MNDARPGRVAVRSVTAPDPADEAARLAKELDADLAADIATAERAVRARVDAGRRAVGGDASADAELLARAGEIRAAAAVPPPIPVDDVEELRHLAADLGRASRIRERTETRVAEVLQARVAASTGVALHPEAVAAAAAAVVAAEQALVESERALAALVDEPPARVVDIPAVEEDPVLRLPHDDFDEADLERRRGWARAVGLAAVLLGLTVVAAVAGAPVVVLPAGFAVAVAAGAGLVLRGRRVASRVDDATAHLAAAVSIVETTESGRLAAELDAQEARIAEQARLEAARDEAEERLRVARNRWQQLAGPKADPHDPDSVIRAHDPQLAYDERVAETSPTIRTVAAFHRRVQARWRVMWASLGWTEPPPPEQLDSILGELLAEHRRATEELRRLEAAEGRAAAAEEVRRPLVLVEPRTWVAPGRLAQLLSSVPPDGEVVVVEKG